MQLFTKDCEEILKVIDLKILERVNYVEYYYMLMGGLNFASRWKLVNFFVYTYHRCQKGVDHCSFLLGSVKLGHRYMDNKNLALLVTRFPPLCPKGELRPLCSPSE